MNGDYVISQLAETGSLYAAFRGRFWLWDNEKSTWVLSPWAESQYTADRKKGLAQSKLDWLANNTDWLLMDDYEVPDAALQALKKANPTQAAPASHADAGAATQSPCAAAPASSAAEPAAFDYTGLDDQTVADLHLAEREFSAGKKLAEIGLRRMADGVAIAHDTLCGVVHFVDNSKHGNRGEDSFRRWCESIGVGKTTAYKLLQVAQLFDASSPQQQKILQELSPSLLYAAAKPSAPAEAVAAVKAGDITTHKEYQEMVARLKSETARADAAERDARSEKDRRSAAEARLDATLADLDAERRRADEAEARPIEVAVQQPGEADLAKYYAEGERRAREKLAAQIDSADRAAAKYKTDNAKLRSQLSGKSDHLAAVEKELAKLKAQLAGYRSSEPVALVRCCDCAYESRCCGLGMLDMPEDELEKLQLALTACAAGKRKN